MNIPTVKEFLEALGFSIGKATLRIRKAVPSFRLVLKISGAAFLGAASVYLSVFLGPPTQAKILFALAVGSVLFGAAGFCYVLFSFMAVLAAPISRMAPGFSSGGVIDHKAPANAAQTPEQAGSFTAYDEERASYQEQLDELQKSGLLTGVDLEDLMKEGHLGPIEFTDKMAETSRGEQ